MSGPRWRLFVHALDRTGPPMLARSLARWLHANHPAEPLEFVAFRGGPLEADLAALGPVHVVLDDQEHWDHAAPDPERARELSERLALLAPAGANLVVSVSAGQPLPLLRHPIGPVVTWVVEIGEDLHWLDGPTGVVERTDLWLAGSEATAAELALRVPTADRPIVVAEFVDAGSSADEPAAAIRRDLALAPDELLVLGAGIGTHRKGVDLFVEAAAGHRRRGGGPARFVWIGGERDPLLPRVRRELTGLGLAGVELIESVPDLDPWCSAADVFLHPARADAFPLVCLHAALQGTPVVAFAGVGGVTEMFGPHFRGAPFPDVAGLVDQLCLFAGAAERAAVGAAQEGWVRARYETAAAAPALRRALVGVAGGRAEVDS